MLYFVNLSPHSATYMHQVNWVSIGSDNGLWPIRCQAIIYTSDVNWTLRNKLQWNFNQNTRLSIHQNASENIVCEMEAILSKGRWVNSLWPSNAVFSHRTRSSLLQGSLIVAYSAPRHYLNSCSRLCYISCRKIILKMLWVHVCKIFVVFFFFRRIKN